jgi:Leucine-rich repeat (LRR) protein
MCVRVRARGVVPATLPSSSAPSSSAPSPSPPSHTNARKKNANQTTTETSLYNLSCGVAGGVVGLQLESNNLRGLLDARVAAAALAPLAPSVEILYLSENAVRGPLALLMRGMRRLYVLSAPSNGLTGGLPSEVGDMPNLYIVDVANNQLSQDRLPVEALLRCKKLSRLLLSSNRFRGPAPIALIQLDAVVVLSLDNNAFDSLPAGVLPLPQRRRPPGVVEAAEIDPRAVDRVFWLDVNFGFSPLFEVSLRGNQLRGAIPLALLAQPCAQIDLGENQLTGICVVVVVFCWCVGGG